MDSKVLHIGCGEKKRPGSIGLDIKKLPGVDVVWDLSKGLPFEDNRFECLIAEHVLEHLSVSSFNYVIEEIYRVCKADAVVEIIVPHYSGRVAWVDPTHYRGFSGALFDFYYSENPVFKFYSNAKFAVISRRITKSTGSCGVPMLDFIYNSIFIKLVNFLGNLSISLCESIWCYWVGGFDLCQFKLLAKK